MSSPPPVPAKYFEGPCAYCAMIMADRWGPKGHPLCVRCADPKAAVIRSEAAIEFGQKYGDALRAQTAAPNSGYAVGGPVGDLQGSLPEQDE